MFYLAYGSNLNLEQMNYRCPGAVPVGTAFIKNHRLSFRGSGTGNYLTIDPAEGYRVPVAVWQVDEAHVAALDRYEGYPDFYTRETVTLDVKPLRGGRKKRISAFVYIMTPGRPLGKPFSFYLRGCAEGYRSFGFDLDILNEAYIYSKEGAENNEK